MDLGDIESFEYVNGLFQYLCSVTVRADSPYKTFEDLVEEARKDLYSILLVHLPIQCLGR